MKNRIEIQAKIKEFTNRTPSNPSDWAFGKQIKLCAGCGMYFDREHSKYQILTSASIEELEEVLKYRKAIENHGSN